MREITPDQFLAVAAVDEMEEKAAPAPLNYDAEADRLTVEDASGWADVIAELRLRARLGHV